MKTTIAACLLALAVPAGAAAADKDEDPPEYRDRSDYRDAYRRGYERGYERGHERGYEKGLEEGRRSAVVAPPPPPAAPKPTGPIRIVSAQYGTYTKVCNAMRFVRRQTDGKRSASFKVTNEMCGDPSHGDRKTLEVAYRCGQVERTASAREHQTISLSCY